MSFKVRFQSSNFVLTLKSFNNLTLNVEFRAITFFMLFGIHVGFKFNHILRIVPSIFVELAWAFKSFLCSRKRPEIRYRVPKMYNICLPCRNQNLLASRSSNAKPVIQTLTSISKPSKTARQSPVSKRQQSPATIGKTLSPKDCLLILAQGFVEQVATLTNKNHHFYRRCLKP